MTRIFKTLTVISFLFIIVNGEHIGGPLGFFILGQLFQTNLFAAIISILVISVLILFIYSSIRPLPKADLFVFSIGGLILTIPIGLHISYLVKNINFIDEKPFILTLLIYLLVFGITIIKIYRQRLKTTKKIK